MAASQQLETRDSSSLSLGHVWPDNGFTITSKVALHREEYGMHGR